MLSILVALKLKDRSLNWGVITSLAHHEVEYVILNVDCILFLFR